MNATAPVVKQRANVYTVMLVVSFLCLVIGCVFLYFEMERYGMEFRVDSKYKASGAEAAAQEALKQGDAAPVVEEPMPMDMPADGEMPPADGAAPMPMDMPPADGAAPPADGAAPPADAAPKADMPADGNPAP